MEKNIVIAKAQSQGLVANYSGSTRTLFVRGEGAETFAKNTSAGRVNGKFGKKPKFAVVAN